MSGTKIDSFARVALMSQLQLKKITKDIIDHADEGIKGEMRDAEWDG